LIKQAPSRHVNQFDVQTLVCSFWHDKTTKFILQVDEQYFIWSNNWPKPQHIVVFCQIG